MSILVLSPHYDDAVYSCGGTIYQHVQNGEDVTILTIMAGVPSLPLPETPILKFLHERWDLGDNQVMARRKEDEAAAKILGTKTRYLDLPDCIYRQHESEALYPTEESLWGAVHPQDPAHAVLENLDLGDASLIYAPLGAGRHVDHQLVRDWALKLEEAGRKILFYEDYPYLREPENIEMALAHFSVMQPHENPLSEDAIQAKIAAMKAYASQISSFWENTEAIDTEVRQSFRHAQGYVERTWGKQS